MSFRAGDRVVLKGLRHKAHLNDAEGSIKVWDEDLDAWEVDVDGGSVVTVKEEHLTSKAPEPIKWVEELFGPTLGTKEGVQSSSEVLRDKRAVLIYFADRWCEGIPALQDAYINHDAGDVEVVYVSSDGHQSHESLLEFASELPFPFFPGSEERAGDILKRFDCTFVPFLPVLNGTNGTLACRNARNQIENREDFASLLNSWGL